MSIIEAYNINDWLLILYIAAGSIQLIYFWLIFGRFVYYKTKTVHKGNFPVSVVICAKNEYQGLKKNLPLILDQDYPEYEVVVVNDASDDETIFLLEDLSRENKHLKIVTITEDLNFFRGKKFPLALGIKSAGYEHLLLTDADCTPNGRNWISSMASSFTDKKEIVLGYGKYSDAKGFLNKIIRYETAFTAMQYFSMALWGSAYMGVGRNLAYKKDLFLKNKGFISHYNVSSGDDDLFINKVATRNNTAITYSPESFTLSVPKKTFSEWWRQKRRHLTTGKYYRFKHKLVLGVYSFSFYMFLTLFIILLLLNSQIEIALIIFVTRLLSQLVLFSRLFYKLKEKKLLLLSPIIELIITFVYPIMVFSNLVHKESRWK